MKPILPLALVAVGMGPGPRADSKPRTAEKAATVVRELRTGSIRYAVLVGKLAENRVSAAALQLLGPVEAKFGRLVVYASRDAEMAIERESHLDECSWEGLVTDAASNSVRIAPGHCPEVSEAIKIGPSMVLRTVDSECRVKKKLLLGNGDPLWMSVGNIRSEILAVSLWPPIGGRPATDGDLPRVHVFVRVKSPLTNELAQGILTRLKEVSAASEILVAVRNDADFFTHCSFPAPYLFGGADTVVKLETKRPHGGGEVICGALDPWPARCWSYDGK